MQGREDKLTALNELLAKIGISLAECAYIGMIGQISKPYNPSDLLQLWQMPMAKSSNGSIWLPRAQAEKGLFVSYVIWY